MAALNIKDPEVKMAVTMLQMGLDHLADNLVKKAGADRKKVDAINAARAALDGGLQALVNLT